MVSCVSKMLAGIILLARIILFCHWVGVTRANVELAMSKFSFAFHK